MTDMLDSAAPDFLSEPEFDRLTGLLANATGAPVALLTVVEPTRQVFKCAHGLAAPWAEKGETPLSHSFCKHVAARDDLLEVGDARCHPVLCENRAVEAMGVIAYLGAPIHDETGRAIGSLCAIDGAPRDWSARDRATVRTLAEAVDTAIALRGARRRQNAALGELDGVNEALSARMAELTMARLSAEAALARQTQFIAGLSHEVRTPLNGVLGGVALLEAGPGEEQARKLRAMIRASADALSECVDDLVSFCRIGSAQDPLDIAPFAPVAVAREALDAVAASAAAKGLALSVDPGDDAPATWRGDARRVRGVLMNLLGNAVKYTETGGVTVSIMPWGDALALRVRDTGRGVPEAHAETIFEPFNRGDPATARSAAGTGLGLAIARKTAEQMGGSLTLERTPEGAGATFLLLLPPAEAAATVAGLERRTA